eukprot:766628-Hanusia_phi.AAC.2
MQQNHLVSYHTVFGKVRAWTTNHHRQQACAARKERDLSQEQEGTCWLLPQVRGEPMLVLLHCDFRAVMRILQASLLCLRRGTAKQQLPRHALLDPY